MALVILLRSVNVGGHKTLRLAVLAKELSRLDVVNIGAAGTFVVRNLDWQARRVVFEAKASAEILIDVREKLRVDDSRH